MSSRVAPRSHAIRVLVVTAALGLGACGAFQNVPLPAAVVLRSEVIRILDAPGPTPEFYRARAPLETMGPELDEILVPLIEDADASETVRANAAILLADRKSFVAVPVLRRVLLGSANETVRVGALLGLLRLSPRTDEIRSAVRAAIGDPSAQVRLNVLQALDVEDSALLRDLLRRETNAQVRVIARQLLGLLEARGAPLVRSPTGEFRSAADDSMPRIVFAPTVEDTLAGVASGALWVEMPRRALLPLSQAVEVVGGVVPAFFDPRGRYVVYEAEREIRIRDLRTGATRTVGEGLAPRPIPFTGTFAFVRELPRPRPSRTDTMTVLRYDVLRAAFANDLEPVRIGSLTVLARPGVHGAASPVRWMEVAEARGGFALQGDGIVTPLPLPNPFVSRYPGPEIPPAVTRPTPPCPAPAAPARPRGRRRGATTAAPVVQSSSCPRPEGSY